MKLISRKALTATIAAAAISTASLTAPAMAETPNDTTVAENTVSGSSKGIEGLFGKTGENGDEKTGLEKLTDVVSFITQIAGLFAGLTAVWNAVQGFFKNFMPK